MLDYIRITTAVPDVQVADTDYNTQEISNKIFAAEASGSDIVVFPELAITGYTCGDLFLQKTLLIKTLEALSSIVMASRRYKSIIVVGAPLRLDGQLYNCACIINGGKVLGIVPKTFVPNYNEFSEKRWFSSASSLGIKSVKASELELYYAADYEIPVGVDLLFTVNNEVSFGVEIGEDLWSPLPPSTLLALKGAELVINISASNEIVTRKNSRRQLIKQQSASMLGAYVYVSAGVGESTTDLVFSGYSCIAENGMILKENKKLVDGNYTLTVDVDYGKLIHERIRNKTFKESSDMFVKDWAVRRVLVNSDNILKSDGSYATLTKTPFIPLDKAERDEHCRDIFTLQVEGLKKRMRVTKAKPVIGVSGGLDSTLALLVCVQAVKELGLPLTDVIGITMPGFGTTGRTYNNSLMLMDSLGITVKEISIKEACTVHAKDIGHDLNNHNVTYENIQARERAQVLMDYACSVNGFVVGTGDLSELVLGWCTYNADHMSMYGVNGGVPKTLIRWLLMSLCETDLFNDSAEILKDIIDTPISPELLPPDETGRIAQKTEDLVGPYSLHDFFIYYVLRYGFAPTKIYHLACKAFAEDYDGEFILKWLKTFYRRFFTQQFKRSCQPDGVKVGSVGISPRGDLKMPSDASSAIWLEEVESLEPIRF